MITKYFQSIKNIKTTIPAIAFQVQEIVFILPVIPFQIRGVCDWWESTSLSFPFKFKVVTS